jgi:O-antigen/teichoic acid export membrane protein
VQPSGTLWVVSDDGVVQPPGPDGEPTATGAPQSERREEYRGRRVAVNSLSVVLGQGVFTLLGLVVTPVQLSHIGLVEFGLWAIITTAVGYVTVVDPGFSDMITRYGAMAHLRGDRALAARLCSLATLVWIGFGLACLPLLFWVVPHGVPHLHLAPALRSVAIRYCYWGYLITIAGCVSVQMSARLTAIGDQWLVTIIDVVTRFVYCGVLLGLLFSGFKLSALVIATFVQMGLSFLATIAFVVARAGAPYGNPFRLHGPVVREVIRFGSWLQLGGILEALTYETDPVVIGTFVSVARTGTYNIGQRAAGKTTYFAFVAQESMLSAMSASYAAGEGLAAMRRMYTRANRLVGLLGGMIGGAFLGVAPVFLAAWLGRFYSFADVMTCLAVVALLIGLPRPAAAASIMAMGRVGLGVRAQVAAFVVNLVLTLALVEPMGFYGVMLATIIAKLVATGYLLVRFHRMIEGGATELLFSWLNKLVLAIGLGAAADRLVLAFLPSSVEHDRYPALVAFLALGILYVAVFTLVIRATRYFTGEDLRWFDDILPDRFGRIVRSPIVHRLIGSEP